MLLQGSSAPRQGFPLHWQMVVSLVLSVLLSIVLKYLGEAHVLTIGVLEVCETVGKLFMNGLRMIMVPVIITSLITGLFSMGNEAGMGRLVLKTLVFYVCSSILAITLGITLVNVIGPGRVSPEKAAAIVGQGASSQGFIDKVEGRGMEDLVGILERMIPSNVFLVTTDNTKLLGLIVATMAFGFFLNRLTGRYREVQQSFWEGLHEAVIGLTEFIIKFAPIGVFALVLPVFYRTGVGLIMPLLWFFVTTLLALGLHMFVTMGLILWGVARIDPRKHYHGMRSVMLTAFSTSSSAATLPFTLDALQTKAQVSRRVASFTLPLGATINMDGTALYECIVVLFVAQVYSVVSGFEITVAMQGTVVVLALLTSIGVAGIPSSSLVAIALILSAVGLPLESVGLVLAVDRILDMCRTVVNIFGDSVGAIVIARSEGEELYRG